MCMFVKEQRAGRIYRHPTTLLKSKQRGITQPRPPIQLNERDRGSGRPHQKNLQLMYPLLPSKNGLRPNSPYSGFGKTKIRKSCCLANPLKGVQTACCVCPPNKPPKQSHGMVHIPFNRDHSKREPAARRKGLTSSSSFHATQNQVLQLHSRAKRESFSDEGGACRTTNTKEQLMIHVPLLDVMPAASATCQHPSEASKVNRRDE